MIRMISFSGVYLMHGILCICVTAVEETGSRVTSSLKVATTGTTPITTAGTLA